MLDKIHTFTLACAVCCGLNAAPLGTSFNYQGTLAINGTAASGLYDMSFALYDAPIGGNQIGQTVTVTGVQIASGAFTTSLDFGSVFNGASRWLELGVSTNSASGFIVLGPRQLITAIPYSQFAIAAGSVGSNSIGGSSLQLGAVSSNAIAPGTVVRSLNGLFDQVNLSAGANITLTPFGNGLQISAAGGGPSGGWGLSGNAGTSAGNFLGTVDNQPLELWVNANRAFRLEPTAAAGTVNVLGGSPGNFIAPGVAGATIAGGGSLNYFGTPTNTILAGMSTIGGGDGNSILANASESTIAGGNQNTVQVGAFRSAIGGGFQNSAAGPTATVAGGTANAATGPGSFIGGGGYDGFQFAGNTASGAASVVNGGYGNRGVGDYSAIGGGYFNLANDTYSTVGGGLGNFSTSLAAAVSGGENNTASGFASTVGGGYSSTANGNYATVPGGENNAAQGNGSLAAGRKATAAHAGVFVWNDGTAAFSSTASNQFLVSASGGVGINTPSPRQALDVNGQFMVVDGLGNEQAYIGGDGIGNDVQVGSLNPNVTAVAFWNGSASAYMHVYCSSLTIEGGADLAEPFEIAAGRTTIPLGAVVVIDEEHPGQVKMSQEAYDPRVAGVLSGAGGVSPGIRMQQQGILAGGKNVALAGRVYVLADASYGPIKPGDQLTTSPTPGHAMRVEDHARAQGAVLGKAMTPLYEGKGMVLVLVSLH